MKTKNTFIPARFDLVVTRHKPLVEWLRREGHINPDTPVVEHAHADRDLAELVERHGSDPGNTAGFGFDVFVGRRHLRSFHISNSLDGNEERLHARAGMLTAAKASAAAHNAANVRDRHVIGVLPHHLSSKAATVTEVQLDWTLEDREAMTKGDLGVAAVARAARGLHTYVVNRVEAQHMHSGAVAAAWRYVEKHGTNFGAGPLPLDYMEKCFRGLRVDVIGSGCTQVWVEVIMSRGLWRPMGKGPWLDALGREVAEEDIEPATGWTGATL